MNATRLLIDTTTVTALLLAWAGAAVRPPEEGTFVATLVLAALTIALGQMLAASVAAARARREERGEWWGPDATIRMVATPLALGGAVALAVLAGLRADVGVRLGGIGSLLVLLVVGSVCAKLVAETYLFAQLGGEPSLRQESAKLLNGRYSLIAKLRYLLGGLGGVVLPLGAQLLSGGAKNIPAVVDAGPPAVLAVCSLVCLLPAEMLERWLFWRAVAPIQEEAAEPAPA